MTPLAQRIPAKYRQWIYDALLVGSAVTVVFPEVLPTTAWSRVAAFATLMGFTIARGNVKAS